jgi:signal transduction histidine kinase
MDSTAAGPALPSGDDGFAARMLRARHLQRLATVGLVTLLVSLGALVNPSLVDFFSPMEIALAWFGHLVELAAIALALLSAYTLLDAALPRRMRWRLSLVIVVLFGVSLLLTLLLYGYYAHSFQHLPPRTRLLADSLHWGLPAIFLALIADVQGRALQADTAALAAEMSQAKLDKGESEQHLALLQAQIEPHFLFNVLISVRRLYRTQPQAGADAIANLMRYLRAALPGIRSQKGSLGDELALVRAYLDLFQVRMGARLAFSIEADATLLDFEFPPMLVVTLVENALKHGLEPAGGGTVLVQAQRRRQMLEVCVLDDGAGFESVASSGTGVGLANVRRQLAAHYPAQGSLELTSRAPRGADATIVIPMRAVVRRTFEAVPSHG